MQKWKNWPTIIIDDNHRYKIGLDLICEFLHQLPDDVFTRMDKPNMTVEDYGLEQFQRWIGRKIDETERYNNT